MQRCVPVLLLLAPVAAQAQTCLRGRPAPACRTFFLTEAFAGVTSHAGRYLVGGEFGLVRTLDGPAAMGLGVAVSNIGVSLRPRYRRWVTGDVALDVGPGVQWVPGRLERVEANARFQYQDRIAAWVSGLMDLGGGSGGFELAAGVGTGAEAGLVTWGAGLVTAVTYFIWYASSVD